jgi:hypothetical protein
VLRGNPAEIMEVVGPSPEFAEGLRIIPGLETLGIETVGD